MATTPSRTPNAPTTAAEDRPSVVIILDPDSYECPDCGVIAVPTDTRNPDPKLEHTCKS